MNHDDLRKLAPCMFCGGEVRWCDCNACDRVWCPQCNTTVDFTAPNECDTLEQWRAWVTEQWNRRAPNAELDALRKDAEKARLDARKTDWLALVVALRKTGYLTYQQACECADVVVAAIDAAIAAADEMRDEYEEK